MLRHDAPQILKMMNRSESLKPIRDSDIQVEDTVLVKEPKLGKFRTPYHPVLPTVTSKNHSMLTAEKEGQEGESELCDSYQLCTEPSCSYYQLRTVLPLTRAARELSRSFV